MELYENDSDLDMPKLLKRDSLIEITISSGMLIVSNFLMLYYWDEFDGNDEWLCFITVVLNIIRINKLNSGIKLRKAYKRQEKIDN